MGNKEMTEELNRHSAAIFAVEDTSSIPELQESQGAEVTVVTIAKEKVLGKLKGLKVNTSSGPDEQHFKFLKEIAVEIVKALMVIFQDSL
eukprot:g28483.t1